MCSVWCCLAQPINGMKHARRHRLRQVWAYVSKSIAEGHQPSIREIGEAIGLSPTTLGPVHSFIQELVDLGYLGQGPKYSSRTLTVNIPFVYHDKRVQPPGDAYNRIVEMRQVDPERSAASMARELGISRERVRQLLVKAKLPTDAR
ncbi:hypothetical protein CMI37_19460 [Candidatus Pacearchaeota archaeon]|nr:hypothetical protein [Candidatus Pacearchaeota archaeon]